MRSPASRGEGKFSIPGPSNWQEGFLRTGGEIRMRQIVIGAECETLRQKETGPSVEGAVAVDPVIGRLIREYEDKRKKKAKTKDDPEASAQRTPFGYD